MTTEIRNPKSEIRSPSYFSVWGIVALAAGLVSVVAIISPLLWAVAGVGLVIGVLAWQGCARRGPAASEARLLATIGLGLSLTFVVAGPTRYFIRQRQTERQAEIIGMEWIRFLLNKERYNAFESSRFDVERRYPLEPGLIYLNEHDPSRTEDYRRFLNHPLVKALTLLPAGAQVRHYETEAIEPSFDGDGEVITDVYAVTYEDPKQEPANRKMTFFIRLVLWRRDDATSVHGLWQVRNYEGGVRPLHPPGK